MLKCYCFSNEEELNNYLAEKKIQKEQIVSLECAIAPNTETRILLLIEEKEKINYHIR